MNSGLIALSFAEPVVAGRRLWILARYLRDICAIFARNRCGTTEAIDPGFRGSTAGPRPENWRQRERHAPVGSDRSGGSGRSRRPPGNGCVTHGVPELAFLSTGFGGSHDSAWESTTSCCRLLDAQREPGWNPESDILVQVSRSVPGRLFVTKQLKRQEIPAQHSGGYATKSCRHETCRVTTTRSLPRHTKGDPEGDP